MQRRKLGSNGPDVSAIGLGGMPMSLASRPSEADAIKVLHAAFDAGMTFVDTADVYCVDHRDIGHNERLVAKAVASWTNPASIVIATKGGLERPDGRWTVNGRPDHLKRACEASLEALGVESITLYQLHAPDDRVPFADTVGALAELQRAGKIQHIGLSNVDRPEIDQANGIIEVVSVQNRCNPFDRTSFDNGVVAHCRDHNIAFLPHSPVGGHQGHNRTPDNPTLKTIGARHGASPYQVCIAWLLALSEVIIPIPGASRVSSAVSSAEATEVRLTGDDMSELNRAFPTGL